jgi:glycosyltransferase involved in cell wall biosynthesis
VGAFEETVFRGVLLRRTAKDFGTLVGVVLTTAIYAVVHVLRGGEDIALGPMAGVERTLGLFAPLADASVLPTLLGLSGLGLVLVVARLRGGSLWLAIGIHTSRGIQNKVLEAIAAGLPVVVTPAVMEGLPAEVRGAGRSGPTPVDFAAGLVEGLQGALDPGPVHLESVAWSRRLAGLGGLIRSTNP